MSNQGQPICNVLFKAPYKKKTVEVESLSFWYSKTYGEPKCQTMYL